MERLLKRLQPQLLMMHLILGQALMGKRMLVDCKAEELSNNKATRRIKVHPLVSTLQIKVKAINRFKEQNQKPVLLLKV